MLLVLNLRSLTSSPAALRMKLTSYLHSADWDWRNWKQNRLVLGCLGPSCRRQGQCAACMPVVPAASRRDLASYLRRALLGVGLGKQRYVVSMCTGCNGDECVAGPAALRRCACTASLAQQAAGLHCTSRQLQQAHAS